MEQYEASEHWENRLREMFGPEGVGYLGLGTNYNRWLYRVKRRVVLREFARLGLEARTARVLDVGCGTGFIVERWKELGFGDVTGFDLTRASVERLSAAHAGYRFEQVDIGEALPAGRAAQFDAVSAFDVLYHIVDDGRYVRAIRNIHALLRPGGMFVLSDNFVHGAAVRVPDQVSHSLEEITRWVSEAGFEIVRRVPLFVLMNYPIDSRGRIVHFFWRGLNKFISLGEWSGNVAGAVMYPLECALTRWFRESPTTEVMVCRKRG